MKKFTILVLLFFFVFLKVNAQEKTDIEKWLENFKLSAAVDVYYAWDTDKEQSLRRFSSLSPYRDEFRLNMAQVSVNYNSDAVRGIFTLQYGDIPRVNWLTASPSIQEANIGFKLYKDLWLDAGYFVTHIGVETFPRGNYFSTFALQSYYEPFYQSGIKLSYDFSKKFSACVHLLNGYNVIEDNNKNKSAGLQLIYAPNDIFKFTYNNIIGNEQPNTLPGKARILNNLIVGFTGPCGKMEALLGIDFGYQEKSKLSDPEAGAYTYGAMLSLKYKFNSKFSTQLRGEFYQDLDGVYSDIVANNIGVKGNGVTVGCEFNPVEQGYVRLEARYLSLDKNLNIFYDGSNTRTEVVFSTGFSY
jgi:hypothetical protein